MRRADTSHKTEAVMRLLTGNNAAVNPILDNDFKLTVIEARGGEDIRRTEEKTEAPNTSAVGVQPAEAENTAAEVQTAPPAEAVREEIKPAFEAAEIRITSELITELLPQVLDRFKCCKCGSCFAEAMTDAIEAIPEIVIPVQSAEDVEKAHRIKEDNRRDVMNALVKIAIGRRAKPKHE